MPATPAIAAKSPKQKAGLAVWMERALEECNHASAGFEADPVHDLRVALRRCRSMADGLMAIDPDPSWKQLKKAGKQLFSSLGDLRDMQVMEEWTRRLGDASDPVTDALLQFLLGRESQLKDEAAKALANFDHKQWKRWSASLPRRAARMRSGSLICKHLALERLTEAHNLHRRALRGQSQAAFHRLRIGIKRFRYIVENFLPEQHAAWSDDLKELQDLLGEVHDLDVLWTTALQIQACPDQESRSRWHSIITKERNARIETYKQKMAGKDSLWQVWRAELPCGKQVEAAALMRLKLWASFLDPDFRHSQHVTQLALQLYDGLRENDLEQRRILQLAALLHDVGRSKREKNHHKTSCRMIQRLNPPLGCSAATMHLAGIVARYHRGALPRAGQKTLSGLAPAQRRMVVKLAGMLRLANAFDTERNGRIQRLQVAELNGCLAIAAQGYTSRDGTAEQIAAARHLLETYYRRPILVRSLRLSKPRTANRRLKRAA